MINNKQKHSGFSLIELMIAMLIGVLMLLAATGLFISNKRIYNEQNEMGRLQENSRFAIDMLTKDIRMAGYGGCLDDLSSLSSSVNNAGVLTNLHNSTNFIEGINGKTPASTWSPSASTEQVANMTGTAANIGSDAITLRYLEPIPNQVEFTTGVTMGGAGVAIPVTCYNGAGNAENCSASHITPNENMAISNCSVGDIFIATGSTATTITHGAALSEAYTDAAQISRYVTTRYYIGTAANPNKQGNAVPALFRFTSVAGVPIAQELIEGVERMEILYGVDSTIPADGIPDNYLAAGAVGLTTAAHWATVTSVKITLLIRTIDDNVNLPSDTNTYSLLDADGTAGNDPVYNPADQRLRRKTYTTTVHIRNSAI